VITVLLVILAGGVAALARLGISAAVQLRRRGVFPLGTLLVNLGGCFVLGVIDGVGISASAARILETAMLGSYTTFSTWMLETHRPAQDGDAGLAWQNVLVSLAAGLAAVALGRAAGGTL
jgi:fluoride exporter